MVKALLLAVFFCLLCAAVSAEEKQLIDPMRPAYQSATSTSPQAQAKPQAVDSGDSWQLSAVLVSADRSVAIINGQSLSLGASYRGYKVAEIESDRVVLKNSVKRIVLHRSGTGLKKILAGQNSAQGSQP